jgi:hypothetical protein
VSCQISEPLGIEADELMWLSYGGDSYEQIQQRREAAIVLDNPELLMMHAQSRNDVRSLLRAFRHCPCFDLLTKARVFRARAITSPRCSAAT